MEIKIDPSALFLEETFTDRKVGTIRRLTPVKRDGTPDPAGKILYVGETQVMSPIGALPIAFEIDARSVAEAAEKFGDQAKDEIERTVRELREMQRQQASQIVIPQIGAGDLTRGPLPGGGGGKIKLP